MKIKTMAMEKEISAKTLNRAMYRSCRQAIRTNKALGLDTVFVKGRFIVLMDPSGKIQKLKKLGSMKVLKSKEPLSLN